MLTKWIIDGRKKPWPTSELFVGYDSHESVRRGQKLRPRLVHASIARGIIAIGNTEADGVRMLYTIGSVDQIKRALVELALEDKIKALRRIVNMIPRAMLACTRHGRCSRSSMIIRKYIVHVQHCHLIRFTVSGFFNI